VSKELFVTKGVEPVSGRGFRVIGHPLRNTPSREYQIDYLPDPLSVIICFPAVVLSVTVTVADRVPVAVGVKVTVIRHVASGLMLPGFGHVVAGAI
jgi:hypothetical protein